MKAEELIGIRRELHKIPELGFKETKTQQYILDYIQQLPQDHLQIKTWETGVLIKVLGTDATKTIAYRADIDGLPIQEDTGYAFQSTHEGNMHACGHDMHMTIALGALTRLAREPAEQNALFLFQPAEEGPGGALPMIESEQLKEWWPDTVFALHIAPELPVGTISSRKGLLFANTSELFIDFKGKGGHAAYPHFTRDMVLAASQFTVQAQQIVARNVDPLDSAVVTIGKIEGGFVQNVIAENARLEGTMRSFHAETMDLLKEKIEALAKGTEISQECSIKIDYGSNYYQVRNSEKFIEPFQKIVEDNGYHYRDSKPAMTGEDFGYMLRDISGFMFWLGVDSPYGLHHSKLQPNEEALEVGVNVVEASLRRL
ncbi:amidohydrolase [Pontibacillus yanchengensis]|uniref:N-acetyldiaminopimelate deacetylase n=1 Tax=Pontibacillus yanchengensis TaxID=462910 RepID=A0A6I5A2B3_9BACI|nr:N-acetyldiaminopimelate deacetylase [Pontibacillus yanchengensis]MYL34813.1 amidohydrolase [Pontibacillus yanchengensis]